MNREQLMSITAAEGGTVFAGWDEDAPCYYIFAAGGSKAINSSDTMDLVEAAPAMAAAIIGLLRAYTEHGRAMKAGEPGERHAAFLGFAEAREALRASLPASLREP